MYFFSGKHIDDHINLINSWNARPRVVTADWLVECVNQGRPVDEDRFLYPKLTETVVKNINPSSPSSYSCNKATLKSCQKNYPEDDKTILDEELMKQYLNSKDKKSISRNKINEKSFDCSTLPSSQDTTTSGIFRGMYFGYIELVLFYKINHSFLRQLVT